MALVDAMLCALAAGGATGLLLVEIAQWRARRSVRRYAAEVQARLRADCDRLVAETQRDLDRIFADAGGARAHARLN